MGKEKEWSEMTKQVYFGDWEKGGRINMVGDFEDIYMDRSEYEATQAPYPNAEKWADDKARMTRALADEKWAVNVLFAAYTYESYEGDAFVLFERDGKLFEVNGGHCSCHGLEGQWEPEETTFEAVRHRLDEGSRYGVFGRFADEIRSALDREAVVAGELEWPRIEWPGGQGNA